MNMSSRDELLRPSLGAQATPLHAPYSANIQFLAAFAGGPLAAVACWALNTHRLGRWRLDLPLLVPALLAAVGIHALLPSAAMAPLLAQLNAWLGGGAAPLLVRALAIALAGLALWLHRRERRACELMGVAVPNGLVLLMGIVAAGYLLGRVLHRFFA